MNTDRPAFFPRCTSIVVCAPPLALASSRSRRCSKCIKPLAMQKNSRPSSSDSGQEWQGCVTAADALLMVQIDIIPERSPLQESTLIASSHQQQRLPLRRNIWGPPFSHRHERVKWQTRSVANRQTGNERRIVGEVKLNANLLLADTASSSPMYKSA